jgi:hypothetical protein
VDRERILLNHQFMTPSAWRFRIAVFEDCQRQCSATQARAYRKCMTTEIHSETTSALIILFELIRTQAFAHSELDFVKFCKSGRVNDRTFSVQDEISKISCTHVVNVGTCGHHRSTVTAKSFAQFRQYSNMQIHQLSITSQLATLHGNSSIYQQHSGHRFERPRSPFSCEPMLDLRGSTSGFIHITDSKTRPI